MESDYYYDEDEDVIIGVLSTCVLPVILQITEVFIKIYGLALMVRLATLLKNDTLVLVLDVLCGTLLSFLFYSSNTFYILLLVLISYLVLAVTCSTGRCGLAILVTSLLFVFICELSLVRADNWHMIRGSVMLLLMKGTSCGFDIDAGVIGAPNAAHFVAYCLSPASLIFGPFCTLSEYRKSKTNTITLSTLLRILDSVGRSYAFVLISSCVLSSLTDLSTDSLIGAYFAAMSFRCSHYFVCYCSQASALIGGLEGAEPYSVVSPGRVELPSSMGDVAKSWNLPMHYWLKTYVYKKSRPYGMGVSAFCTYVSSSILHGLNFQLPAVLISIFAFSFVETILRYQLAVLLDAPVESTRSSSTHKNRIIAPPINFCFTLLNIALLAYLGVIFGQSDPSQTEGYSWFYTVKIWSSLHWYGHVLCGAGLVLAGVLSLLNDWIRVRAERRKETVRGRTKRD